MRVLLFTLLGLLSLHRCYGRQSRRREELIRELMDLEEQEKASPCQCHMESQREFYHPTQAGSRLLEPMDTTLMKGKRFKVGLIPDPPNVIRREDDIGGIRYEGGWL